MTWREALPLDQLDIGVGCELLVEGRIVALFRVEAQTVLAIDGICAHQGGPIARGALDGNCVTCPWHGWQYDIATGKNVLTGKKMLACFPTEIRDDVVWIDVQNEA